MDAPVKIKRRSRWRRQSTGVRVSLGKYESTWFQELRDGPLPLPYLYEFTKDIVSSWSTVKHRAGDLYHEDNTQNGGPYLNRPDEQYRAIKCLYEVYENDTAAEEYLKQHGLIPHASAPSKKINYAHRLMVACTLASIRLGCREAGLQFVRGEELLQRAPSLGLKIPMTISHKGERTDKPLIPDGYFGIQYGNSAVRAFLLEADRNNEPAFTSGLDRTSYLRKLLQYQELFSRARGEPLYKEHFGLKSGMLVLNVMSSYAHMETVMALLLKLTDGKGSPYMLFKTAPVFADKFAVPPVMTELLTTPWRRAGHPDIDISKP